MSNGFDQLLAEIRGSQATSSAVGSRFEEAVKVYFNNDPVMQQSYTDCVLWSDWAREHGEDPTDQGIDLVATIRSEQGAGYAAIQAKCYSNGTQLQRPHLNSFFAYADTLDFEREIVADTTGREFGKKLVEFTEKRKNFVRLSLADFQESRIDWDVYVKRNEVQSRAKKAPRQHQKQAVEAVRKGLKCADRGQLIMACGTGKTYTGLLVAEQMFGPGKRILVLVPSLALMSQMIREWHADATVPLRSFSICSDTEVTTKHKASDDIIQLTPSSLAIPPTTSYFDLAGSAKEDEPNQMTVVFGTYHSIQVIHRAQKKGLYT